MYPMQCICSKSAGFLGREWAALSSKLPHAHADLPIRKLQPHAGKTAGRLAVGSWPAKSEAAEMS